MLNRCQLDTGVIQGGPRRRSSQKMFFKAGRHVYAIILVFGTLNVRLEAML